MKNHFFYLLFTAAIFVTSCSPANRGLFVKKTQHEKYAEKLDKSDLDETPEGKAWLAAARSSLSAPHTIALPYHQKGVFHADKPRALGLAFKATRGEKISFTLTRKVSDQFVVYADLFQPGNEEHKLVLSGDTNTSEFSFDVEESGNYVLRLQPEINRTGEYELRVSAGPSLAFPVSGTKASIGSFWGADRDGGKRSHEGIDIFAPKKTPVIASADGYVTGVREGGIGGKTVWLRVKDKNITLYYAHLDQQLVTEGQYVKKGETLGLVGNTGNAKSTPPHLHFGIYTSHGAENPLSFVNLTEKKPTPAPTKNLDRYLKLVKTVKHPDGQSLKANTILVPLAVNAKGYIAELSDGQRIIVPFSSVKAEGMVHGRGMVNS